MDWSGCRELEELDVDRRAIAGYSYGALFTLPLPGEPARVCTPLWERRAI